jgi:hypothetical protein
MKKFHSYYKTLGFHWSREDLWDFGGETWQRKKGADRMTGAFDFER